MGKMDVYSVRLLWWSRAVFELDLGSCLGIRKCAHKMCGWTALKASGQLSACRLSLGRAWTWGMCDSLHSSLQEDEAWGGVDDTTETLEDRQLMEGGKVSGVCEIFLHACFPVSCCVTLNKLQHLSECPHLLTTECRSYYSPSKGVTRLKGKNVYSFFL